MPIAARADGVYRVGGTRVTLDTVATAFHDGATPEEIVSQYPAIGLDHAYAVISYYRWHQPEVDAYHSARATASAHARVEIEHAHHPQGLRARLMARRAATRWGHAFVPWGWEPQNDILRGVKRRDHRIAIVRTQDVGLSGVSNPDVLQWAADNSVAVLTHDISTMTKSALARVRLGHRMPGLFETGRHVLVAAAIDEILHLATCSLDGQPLFRRSCKERPAAHAGVNAGWKVQR